MMTAAPVILPRGVAAVVFDMDGLLLDSERLHARAALAAAREVGCPLEMDVFLKFVGTTQAQRVLREHYGDAYPFEELRAAWGRLVKELFAAELTLKAGALELLDLLDKLGLPRAIATSSSHATVEDHLSAQGVRQRFHAVVANGDYANGKPAPDPFLMAAERLGVAPRDCLALEDSFNGIRAASSAGMMTVMVPDLVQPTAEIRGLCVAVVPSLYEIARLMAKGL